MARGRQRGGAIGVVAAIALALAARAPASAIVDPPETLAEDPDYLKALAMIEAERFASALVILEGLRTFWPQEAEVHSLIGLSLRKSGRLDEALVAYGRALALDPRHLGAHAYLGALFVETDRLELARGRLGLLEALCGADCAETRALAAALSEAEGVPAR